MTRFPLTTRFRVIAALCLLGSFLYLSLSLRDIPGTRGTNVLDSPLFPLDPQLLGAGWHLVPPGFFRLTTYPDQPTRLRFSVPGPGRGRLSSSEGVGVEVVGELAYRVPAESVLFVHRRSRGDLAGGLLIPTLEKIVFETVRGASFSKISGAHRFELESTLSTRLGPALRQAGILFLSVRLEAVRMAGGSLGGISLSPIRGTRLLLVGLDGADWKVIDPLLARGRMPNLARLIAEGVRTRLKTIDPVLSPVVWTTAATGFLPPEHGILDFLVTDTRTGQQIPVTSRHRKVKAIWNLLGEAGVPVGVIGWWATWPAEPVDGYVVSDRVAYQLLGQRRMSDSDPRGKTFPPELFRKILPLTISPETISDTDLAPFIRLRSETGDVWPARSENRLGEFRTVLAAARTYTGIALALASSGYQPFEAVYFEGIDTTSHLFMPFRPPLRPQVSEEDFRRFSQAVDSFYAYQDQVLGRLLEKAAPGTSVMVLSDHGFRSEKDRPLRESRIGYATAALWHRKYGILVASGEPFRKGVTLPEASVLDITPTILALFGLPVGEDMQGRPIRELFTPQFLARHPVRYRPSWETGRASSKIEVSDPAGDRALKEKLLSLGYLSQEGTLPHNNLGNSLLARGDSEGAVREFRKAVDAAPKFALVRVNLGRAYLSRGDLPQARRALEGALQIDPSSPEAQVLLANVERAEGGLAKAEARLRQVLERDPSSSEAHKSLGVLFQQETDRRRAVEEYERALQIDPEDAEAYNNLGVVYKDDGRLEEAEVQFHKAIEADADFAGSYNNLALIAMDRDDRATAEKYLKQALDRAPDDPMIHNNLGNLLFRTNHLGEAEGEYRKALELKKDYPEPHNGLGAIRGKEGDASAEIAEYRKAIAINPRYPEARLNLGIVLARRGEPKEAEAQLTEVLDLVPGQPEATAALVRILLAAGRAAESVRLAREAVRIRPEATSLWNLLGEASAAAGDLAGAAEALQNSLKHDPDQPAARRRMEELTGRMP